MSDIKDCIFNKIRSDPQLQILLKKINSGKADFKDTSLYADIFSKIMGSEFSQIVMEIPLDTRAQLCTELLRGSYDDINEVLAQVQASIDTEKGIKIAPQKAEFPEERVQKIADSLKDETVPDETVQRRADTGTANVARSFHDDYIKKNAKFRSNAGLKCYLERETDGNCCPWCAALAGRFLVGEHPPDIFRRHDNCGCTVVLIDGKTRQYAWSKKTWSREEEQEYLKNLDKEKRAKRLSHEQAKALQEKNLPKSLTNGTGNDKIKETSQKPITPITDNAINRVPNVKISGYTDEQCGYIQNQHKELLDYSRKNNENKEVAFVFDNFLKNRREFTGADDRLEFGGALYGKDLFVMHNHPRNSSYSATDMIFILQHDNVKSFSIVKNNGSVEVLTKSINYDADILKKDFERILKKNVKSENISEYAKAVNKLLTKHSQEGGMFEWIK